MKKITLLLAFIVTCTLSNAVASSYKIDNSQVESLFENSVQQDLNTVEFSLNDVTQVQGGDKQPIVAVLLDLFLGGIAIHRVYLGGTPVLIAGYLFTFGGIFGIIPLGDLIVLLVNFGDISKYVDNDAFIMW